VYHDVVGYMCVSLSDHVVSCSQFHVKCQFVRNRIFGTFNPHASKTRSLVYDYIVSFCLNCLESSVVVFRCNVVCSEIQALTSMCVCVCVCVFPLLF
jgi:hypothetical protein